MVPAAYKNTVKNQVTILHTEVQTTFLESLDLYLALKNSYFYIQSHLNKTKDWALVHERELLVF